MSGAVVENQIAELRRALQVEKQRSLDQYRAVRAEARTALRMIREVVEQHAPPGSVPAEEHVEPPLTAEAEMLVRGILAIARNAGS
jgi:hypothetical protein